MGLFQRLFGKKNTTPESAELPRAQAVTIKEPLEDELAGWAEVPFYVGADVPEKELVTVIATAIAAGDRPESEFRVNKIQVKNPEAQLVSLIATAIAAGDRPEAELIVKKIYKRT